MNLLICDSSITESEQILDYYKSAFAEKSENVHIYKFRNGEDLKEYISVTPDRQECVVLSMGGDIHESVSVANDLSVISGDTDIIIIGDTPYDTELLFEMGIFYFIYSPVKLQSIKSSVEKLIHKYAHDSSDSYLSLENKKGVRKIYFSNIRYIMSDKRKLILYQNDSYEDTVYMKMGEISEKLDSRFVRCHQSFLVNMEYIRGISEDGFTLPDNQIIPISQSKYWSSKRKYIEYIKKEG